MIKEYVLSMDELIEKYPLGSKHLIGDEKYIVREHIQPMASTNMASYPAIRFDKSTGYKDSEGTLIFVGDTLYEGCNGNRRKVVEDKENGGYKMEGLGDCYRLPNILEDDWCSVESEYEEYKLYSQKYADSKEKLEIFNNKHKALNIFDALNDSYYHVHIEYYLNGKFQYNVCGSCKQEYIHNPDEELDR